MKKYNYYNSNLKIVMNIFLLLSSLYAIVTFFSEKKFIIAFFIMVFLCYLINNYSLKLNISLFTKVGIPILPFVYIVRKELESIFHWGYELLGNIINDNFIFCSLSLLFINLYVHNSKKPIDNQKNRTFLFNERKEDLVKIKKYVDNFLITGIDAEWGAGKSFLIERLKSDLESTYEIIEINTMMCDFDSLQEIIATELDKVLSNNGVFSTAAQKLKRTFEINSITMRFIDLFNNSSSFYSQFDVLSNDLLRVNKPVLIIIEDIDRIKSDETISKIFNFTEKIASKNIKIIYQFSSIALINRGFSHDYIEKYLPHNIRLTSISLFKVIQYELDSNPHEYTYLRLEHFYILQNYKLKNRFKKIEQIFQREVSFSNIVNASNIRGVKSFLSEVDNEIAKYQYDYEYETLVGIYFIKHFCPTLYLSLNDEDNILYQLKFNYSQESVNVFELITFIEEEEFTERNFKEMLSQTENTLVYLALKLFDFNIDAEIDNTRPSNQPLIKNDNYRLNSIYHNEKKSRIIRKSIAEGRSIYTDKEFVSKKFIREVLDHPKDNWLSNYRTFLNDCFHLDKTSSDNGTIFYMGTDPLIDLLKAIHLYDDEKKYAQLLSKFILMICKNDSLNDNIVQAYRYVVPSNHIDLISIINDICEFPVEGNMNNSQHFAKFLNHYFRYINSMVYNLNIYNYYNPDEIIDAEFLEVVINESINNINHNLIDIYSSYPYMSEAFDSLIKFLEYIHSIISKERSIPSNHGPKIETSYRSVPRNEKLINNLNSITNRDKKKEQIKKAYEQGELYPREIQQYF